MDVQDIIATAGGQRKLGEIAGVDHSTVAGWKRCGRIPIRRAMIINEKMDIPLYEMRPDVWVRPSVMAAE